jgi:proteic killer suppression protein
MIESFNHKGLKRLFEDDDRKFLRADLVERISLLLAYLDAAKVIDDID